MDFPVNHKTILTAEGFQKVKRELDELLTVKRPEVVRRIEEARALGDITENFDYEDARRQQLMVESRIAEIKMILGSATVVECPENNGCVSVGSKVTVKDSDEGFEEVYTIVGPPEADPMNGKISYESSVGAALMERKAGDVVSVQTPGGQIRFEIVSID